MDVKSIIAIGIMLLINTTVFLALVYVLFPMNSDIYSGLLSFFGAIVGGALTLIGVRMTILKTSRDRFLDSYHLQIHKIDEFIEKTNKIRLGTNILKTGMLIDYKDIIEFFIDELYSYENDLKLFLKNIKQLKDFDWDTINEIEKISWQFFLLSIDDNQYLRDKFEHESALEYYESRKQYMEEKYYKNAIKVHSILTDYKNKLLEQYKRYR
jgi:hypothetical protein